jgi:hypothetical protein
VTLELTSEAKAGIRLRVNRMFKVVDVVSIEKQELAKLQPDIAVSLNIPVQKVEDVITTAVIRCGDFFDFMDALHGKADLRSRVVDDKEWKDKFLEATKLSEKDFDIRQTDPLQYDID